LLKFQASNLAASIIAEIKHLEVERVYL